MEIDIQCAGMEHLLSRLSSMGYEVNTITNKAIERAAKYIQAKIKVITPVDDGMLRNSIVVEKIQQSVYAIGTNLEYAIYVEYGTGKKGDPSVQHTEKPYWTYYSDKLGRFVRTTGQPPVHFMTKSIENRGAIIAEVKKEMQKWLI